MASRLPGPRGPVAQFRTATGLQWRPVETFEGLHRRYGTVCQFGSWPFKFVALFGAEANQLILADRVDAFRWRDAFEILAPVDGDTALVVSDGPEHKRRRRLVQPAFHTKRINSYVGLMVEETDRALDAWTPGRELDAYVELRRVVRRIVVRALFGDALRARADEIGDILEPALDFLNLSLAQQALKIDLPGTRWRRTKQARARTDEIVDAELARRRSSPDTDDGDDILSMLLTATDEDGGPSLSDEEIRDQVVSLIAAGYETTSAAMAWTTRALLAEPGVLEKAKAEVDEKLGGEAPSLETLATLQYVDGIVHESLRLWSPAVVSGRRSVDDIEYAGHKVPSGTMVLYSPWVTHRLPELWPEPLTFRPERWDSEPLPYSFVPFGGGYRRCIGFAFATLELKVMLTRLVQRCDAELLSADPRPAGSITVRPRSNVPVRVLAQN